MSNPLQGRALGSVWILTRLHPALAFAWVFLLAGLVAVLRLLTEGRYYDYSLASRPGDVLIAGELMAVSAAIRYRLPRGIHERWAWHFGVLAACVAVGLLIQLRSLKVHDGSETVANSYHNFFVVPVLSYSIISTLPALKATRRRGWKIVACVCLVGWSALLAIDIADGNLDRNNPW